MARDSRIIASSGNERVSFTLASLLGILSLTTCDIFDKSSQPDIRNDLNAETSYIEKDSKYKSSEYVNEGR
ncbi:MAG: hypothetical protein AABX10_02730 [Nanoarchaeota archaeon]